MPPLTQAAAPILFDGCPGRWGGIDALIATRLQAQDEPVAMQVAPIADAGPLDAVRVLIRTMSPITEALLERMPGLVLIQQAGAGIEGIAIGAARRRSIAVANIPTSRSGAAHAAAEQGLAMMIALSRGHSEHAAAFRSRTLGMPLGRSLAGQTIGLIGFGAIAQALVALLAPFSVRTIAVNRTGRAGADAPAVDWLGPVDALLPSLLAQADILVLACTLNDTSRHLLRGVTLDQCRHGVRIVNLGRGGLLDTRAALERLETGQIGGLALDVFEQEPLDPSDPLLRDPRVIASPHIAAATVGVVERTAELVTANIMAALAGKPIEFAVPS